MQKIGENSFSLHANLNMIFANVSAELQRYRLNDN